MGKVDERIKHIKIYVDGRSAEIQKVLLWHQCIPYDAGEHLLGTTNAPEE